MLVLPGHISEDQLVNASHEAEKKGSTLQEELVYEGLILDKNLGRTIADYFDHHFVDLHEVTIKDEYLEFIPEIVARAQRTIVCGVTDDTLSLATEKINNYEFFRLLEKKTGRNISVFLQLLRGLIMH